LRPVKLGAASQFVDYVLTSNLPSGGIVRIRGNMVALRLVRLIETHSDNIADCLATRIYRRPQMMDAQEVPRFGLRVFIRELLQHLTEWLLDNRKKEIEAHYRETGARLAQQEVAPAQACWVIVITKEHLWKFLQEEALPIPIELYGEVELLWVLSQFFDRVLCCIVAGYGQSGFQSPEPKYREVNLANWVP
jgi:hypothetical protein